MTCNPTSTYGVDLNGTGPTATGGLVRGSGLRRYADRGEHRQRGGGEGLTVDQRRNVTGTFPGLVNSAVFTQPGRLFRIVYTGTTVTLNDIAPVLTGARPSTRTTTGRSTASA